MSERKLLQDYRVSVLRALADPVRLEIVEFLRGGERCVCEIIPILGRAQSTASKHLDILHQAGILDRRTDGKRTLYRIRDPKIFKLLQTLDGFILNRLFSITKTVEVLKVSRR